MSLMSILSWITSPIVLGAISVVLLVTGTAMVLRDVLRDRRQLADLFVKPAPAAPPAPSGQSAALAGMVATAPEGVRASPPTIVPAPGQPFPDLAAAIADIRGEIASVDENGDASARETSLEASWAALQARVDRLVADAEPLLQGVRITLAPPGEPRWGLANRSYGTYRRVGLSGESIGWLRSELTVDGRLQFRLRAHQPAMALLNAEAGCDLARLDTVDLGGALTTVLLPITRYATWHEAQRLPAASEPSKLERTLQEAADIANGALVEARAGFRCHAQQVPAAGARKFVVDVLVENRQVALMHVEERDGDLEISVGVPDPRRLDLARRHRLPADRVAAFELAEAMATCAWPALSYEIGPAGRTPPPSDQSAKL